MTLSDLIRVSSWQDVSAILVASYPDTVPANLLGYQKVFDHLRQLSPTQSTTRIVIRWFDPDPKFNDPDDVGYWEVSGHDEEYAKKEGWDESQSMALEFTAWAEWLGMEIGFDTLATLSTSEIVAHCLWEMTFCGFTEQEIGAELAVVDERYQDAIDHPENLRVWGYGDK